MRHQDETKALWFCPKCSKNRDSSCEYTTSDGRKFEVTEVTIEGRSAFTNFIFAMEDTVCRHEERQLLYIGQANCTRVKVDF